MGRAEPPFRKTPAATGFATDFTSKFMLGGGDKSRLPVEDGRRIEPTPNHDEQSMKTALAPIPKRLLLAALGFSLTLTTWAYDLHMESSWEKPVTQPQRFGISPFYGYRFGGGVEDLNTGTDYDFHGAPAYGLTLDFAPPNSEVRLELLWSRQETGIDFRGDNGLGNVDVTIDVFQLGGIAEFGTPRFRQYISLHLGVTHFSSDGFGDDTRFSFGAGVGVKAFLTKNFYLRADLRGFGTVVEAEGSFIFYNGVTVASFSGSTLWQGQVSAGLGITF
jgi:hypothetical protein